MAHEIEKVWEHNGYTCVVLMTDMGHRCGYVGIPTTHPLHGVEHNKHSDKLKDFFEVAQERPIKEAHVNFLLLLCWDGKQIRPDICFQVHRGLTYSGNSNMYPIPNEDGLWWFGYDCGHAGDARDLTKMRRSDISFFKDWNDGVLRTLDYCITECEYLAEQLHMLE